MLLAVWGELPRASIVDCLLWLTREGLEREPNAVWDGLAADSADLEALELFPELRWAFSEGLIDPKYIAESELDDVEVMPRGVVLRQTRERHPPIDDVALATAWWARRSANDGDDAGDDDSRPGEEDDWDENSDELAAATEPYRAPPKVGRNQPCPCGREEIQEVLWTIVVRGLYRGAAGRRRRPSPPMR